MHIDSPFWVIGGGGGGGASFFGHTVKEDKEPNCVGSMSKKDAQGALHVLFCRCSIPFWPFDFGSFRSWLKWGFVSTNHFSGGPLERSRQFVTLPEGFLFLVGYHLGS